MTPISEAIALAHEAKPTFDLPSTADEIFSAGGWWRCSHMGERLVQPRHYTDPEIAIRLQEEMFCELGITKSLAMFQAEWEQLPESTHYRERLLLSWALAYCRAKGISVDGSKE